MRQVNCRLPIADCRLPIRNGERKSQIANRQSQRGFTLAELMIAMAIFLVGFVSVAAIFPAAIVLQKQTINEIRKEQVVRSVKALIKGRKFHEEYLVFPSTLDNSNFDTNQRVARFKPTDPNDPVGNWTLRDRSFPIHAADPFKADMYWVPLVRDNDPDANEYDWQIFVFVLQSPANATYSTLGANANDPPQIPKVRSIPATKAGHGAGPDSTKLFLANQHQGVLKIRAGDKVLDNNGVIYTVRSADSGRIDVNSIIPVSPNAVNTLWYAEVGSGNNIVVMTGEIVE